MKRPRSRIGVCTACLGIKEALEFHHIVPQRVETASTESEMVWLCHDCHLQLHVDWIDPIGRQPRQVYLDLTQQFLWEKRNKE